MNGNFYCRINFKIISDTKLFCGKISATCIFCCKINLCSRIKFAGYSALRSLSYIFEKCSPKHSLATPSPLPLLINFWPKMRNKPNRHLKSDKRS